MGRWVGAQRRLRGLVPAPIRRADVALYRMVARRRLSGGGPALRRLSAAADHSRLWVGAAATLALTGGRLGRRAALRGLLAIPVASGTANLPAKLLVGRLRPDSRPVPEARRLARMPASASFPSGHAASAFAFATAAALERPRLGLPLWGLASAVAASRVTTGVHYPSDVLAGAALGVAAAWATTRVWPRSPGSAATAAPVSDVPLPEPDGTGLVLVANGGAGNALAPRSAAHLRRALPGLHTLEADEGEALAGMLRTAAARGRALGVAGGDGSANAGAAAAVESGLPLVVVPAGTLNHLATDLGLEEVDATIRAVRAGRVIAMDVGEVDGRLFVNAASVGAYPHLVDARERLEDRIGKWPAAIWSTLGILLAGAPTLLEIDGRPRRVWLLFFGNGRYTRGGLVPTQRARLDEGLLDVRLVDARVPWARIRLLASLLVGRLGRCASYEHWTAREVRVRSLQGPLRLATDGESWEGSTSFVVRKRPRALLVLQPPPERRHGRGRVGARGAAE